MKKFNVFSYGTLRDKSVLKKVCGKVFPKKEAYIKGFKYVLLSPYPMIKKVDSDNIIEGEILFSVDEKSLMRMDYYEDEGEIYKRIKVQAILKSTGEKIPCFVYVECEK